MASFLTEFSSKRGDNCRLFFHPTPARSRRHQRVTYQQENEQQNDRNEQNCVKSGFKIETGRISLASRFGIERVTVSQSQRFDDANRFGPKFQRFGVKCGQKCAGTVYERGVFETAFVFGPFKIGIVRIRGS